MIARVVAGLLIAAAAIGIWVVMWPEGTQGTSTGSLDSIRKEDSINQMSTAGAPQQAVVNGWTTRDVLFAIAEEEKATSNRNTALLAVGVIGLGLVLMLPRSKRKAPAEILVSQPAPEPINEL